MSHEANPVFEPGLKAAVDLTAAANRYRGVEITAESTVDVADATTDAVIGVLHNNPDAGQAAQVQVAGTTPAKAGAAISAGAKVMCEADGDFETATATNNVVGIAKTAAGADGEIFALLLRHEGIL